MSNCNRANCLGSNNANSCNNNSSDSVMQNILNQATFCRLGCNVCCMPTVIPVDFEWRKVNNCLCFLLCSEKTGPNAVKLCCNQPVALQLEAVISGKLISMVCQGYVTRTCCCCWQDDKRYFEVQICDVDIRTFPPTGPNTCNS